MRNLLLVEGLYDNDTSVLAINLPDWLVQVTCHRCGAKGHFKQNFPVPHDATAQQKNLNAYNNGGKN